MVLSDTYPYYIFRSIEHERERLRRSSRLVEMVDYGTGNVGSAPRSLSVSEIARIHVADKQTAQMLFRLVNHLSQSTQDPLTIIELGTSLGLTTAYLASPSKRNSVHTYEGAQQVVDQAQKVWQTIGLRNIECIIGDIDKTLPRTLPQHADFVYVDANHTFEATINYFTLLLPAAQAHSIYVFDDIHYSPEMERAWDVIRSHPAVTSSIDTFRCGMVFFNPHYLRKHYRIRTP